MQYFIKKEKSYNVDISMVLANSKFDNNWSMTNQYIYSYDNQYKVIMCDDFDSFIKDMFSKITKEPTHIVNILVTNESSRRKIYTAMVNQLVEVYNATEIMQLLCYKIRILNALNECNRYVNDVFMYFDDFKDLEDSLKELIFRNFIVVHNSAVIYFIKQRVEVENNKTRQMIKKAIGKINSLEDVKSPIVNELITSLKDKGLEIENGFGCFDLIIKSKRPMGIIIIGKENEDLNSFVDDYIYYHNEYNKNGWVVKYVYMKDLFVNFDNVVSDLL